MEELLHASATALATAIRAKQVSSQEVIEAHLRRIEEVNSGLNAVVQLAADRARAEARTADQRLARGELSGPLHGVPFTVKDAFETAGIISAAGTVARAHFVPERDATVVARLRQAGGIILGKTNVPEPGSDIETDNAVYGRTNHPWDPALSPGASSGGEAAIIAAGGSPAGVGSDSAGSIRLPAHFCGIAALKPTYGRVPNTGHFPPVGGLGDPRTQSGPLARRVEDLALLLPIIAGPDGYDPAVVPMPLGDPRLVFLRGLRVAIYTDDGVMTPTSATAAAVAASARALAGAGAQVEEARPTCLEQGPPLSGALWESYEDRMSSLDLYKLLVRWDAFRAEMLRFLQRFDAILCPTCAFAAQPHGVMRGWKQGRNVSYTLAYSLAGWPAGTVRGGTSPEGLPIGVQVAAGPWREDVVLAVASCIEQASGGWQPTPLLP